MPRDYRALLEDIAEAAESIREFTTGATKESLDEDQP